MVLRLEAPGEQEDLAGEPFVGKSGQLLDNMLRALGLTRELAPAAQQVYIANTVKCRPPGNRNPQPDELARCEPFLIRQVALVQPKIILAMGRFAVQSLLRSEQYESKGSAQGGIASVQSNCGNDARYDSKKSSDGRHYFNPKAGNHQVIGTSPMFADEAALQAAIAACKVADITAVAPVEYSRLLFSTVLGFALFAELFALGAYYVETGSLFYLRPRASERIEDVEEGRLTGDALHPYFGPTHQPGFPFEIPERLREPGEPAPARRTMAR